MEMGRFELPSLTVHFGFKLSRTPYRIPYLIAEAGFEPAAFELWARRAARLLHSAPMNRPLYLYPTVLSDRLAIFRLR